MKKVLLLITLVFLLGFLSSAFLSRLTSSGIELPILTAATGLSDKELASPADHITQDKIHVYDNRILLDVKDAEWSTFSDTNSMDPVFDKGNNGIEIKPSSADQIKVGDIISYKSGIVEGIIVHRVIEIGQDENGWFAIVKGDNNPTQDPEKVRFSQVQGIVVAVIY